VVHSRNVSTRTFDAATQRRARDELVALADLRKDVPLPQPSAITDIVIPGAARAIAGRMYRPAKMPVPTVIYFHGGGWVQVTSTPTSESIELEMGGK